MVCHLRNGAPMGPLVCCAMLNQWAYGFDPSSSFDFYVLNAGNGRKTFRMVLTTLAKRVPILSAVECKRVTNMSLKEKVTCIQIRTFFKKLGMSWKSLLRSNFRLQIEW